MKTKLALSAIIFLAVLSLAVFAEEPATDISQNSTANLTAEQINSTVSLPVEQGANLSQNVTENNSAENIPKLTKEEKKEQKKQAKLDKKQVKALVKECRQECKQDKKSADNKKAAKESYKECRAECKEANKLVDANIDKIDEALLNTIINPNVSAANAPITLLVIMENGQAFNPASLTSGNGLKISVGNVAAVTYDLTNLDNLVAMSNNPGIKTIMQDPILHIENQDIVRIINSQNVTKLTVSNIKLDGNGKTVCLTDTGVDYTHPDLAGKIILGRDYVNSDDDPMDDDGHGTHVAGTLLAVAPQAKVAAVKVCNTGGCAGSNMISGVQWCIDHKAEYNISVVSVSIGDYNSWTDATCPNWMDAVLQSAKDNNLFVSVASGNQAFTTGINYPACSPYVISVGSTSDADAISPFTNRYDNLDLMAPGQGINSTKLGGGYKSMSGTSMATPVVSASALILNQYYGLNSISKTPFQIRDLLKETGVMVSSWPRIDLLAAVNKDGLYDKGFNPATCPSTMTSYWKFDEQSNPTKDNYGTNDGTLSNSYWVNPTWTNSGKVGGAINFTANSNRGSGSYILIPHSASISPSNAITVSAWINPTNLNDTGILGKAYTSYVSYSYRFFYKSGRIWFELGGTSYAGTVVSSAAVNTPNTWYHISGTYDGSTVRLYVNGNEVASTPRTGAISYSSVFPLLIGQTTAEPYYYRYDGTGGFFKGLIDEVAIYNTALSANEIKNLYYNGIASADYCSNSGAPSSPVCGNNVKDGTDVCDGTDLGGATCSSQGFTGGRLKCASNCLSFDTSGCMTCQAGLASYWRFNDQADLGKDNYGPNDGYAFGCTWAVPTWTSAGKVGGALNISARPSDHLQGGALVVPYTSNLAPTQYLTVSLWIKPADLVDSSIIGKHYAYYEHSYRIYYKSGRIWFEVGGTTYGGTTASSASVDTPNVWYHIAGTYDGTKVRLYVNGNEADSASQPKSMLGPNSGPFTIGIATGDQVYRPSDTGYFNGLIDEVAVYSVALSAAQIRDLYFNGMAGNNICQAASAPAAQCGNNVKEGAEQCDGTDLGGATCSSQGFTGGSLKCSAGCALDTSGCMTCPSGMVSYWRFEQSDLGKDSYGSNDGYAFGYTWAAPTWTSAGKVGGALNVSARPSDHLQGGTLAVPYTVNLTPTQYITVSLWIKPADLVDSSIIGKHYGYYEHSYRVYYQSGKIWFEVGGTTYGGTRASSAAVNTPNVWYHIVGTYDGTRVRLYVNGNEVDSASQPRSMLGPNSGPLTIGIATGDQFYRPSDIGYFNGLIDEVAVYDKALSLGEIQSLYNGGAGKNYCS